MFSEGMRVGLELDPVSLSSSMMKMREKKMAVGVGVVEVVEVQPERQMI